MLKQSSPCTAFTLRVAGSTLRLAGTLAGSLLAVSVSATASPQVAPAAPAFEPGVLVTAAQEGTSRIGKVDFAELSFEDALSRAERTETLLVIYWAGEETNKEIEFRERIFGDSGVERWIAENATAVKINGLQRKRDAKKNGIALENLPTVDILDLARGGRVERLRGEASAIEFLAAVFGLGDAERPTGEDATEPFRWLAWANSCFRDAESPTSGEDAVLGYEWCLTRADQYRPGFRAKYLEFLLQRVAYCKQRTPKAAELLFREHIRIAENMTAGIAEADDVFELTRVDYWLRKELMTRDLFVSLGKGTARSEEYRRWLLPTVLPVLGRFQQYDEILQVVGDKHLALFQARVAALQAGAEPRSAQQVMSEVFAAAESAADAAPGTSEDEAASPKVPTALDFAAVDSRGDVIDHASWVYEALLASGRGKDAKDLMSFMTTSYPVNKTFGLFLERALRMKIWAAAAEIGDLGMAVLDERGQKRMARLLQRIPKDTDGPGK